MSDLNATTSGDDLPRREYPMHTPEQTRYSLLLAVREILVLRERVKELEAELKAEQNRLSDDDGYIEG
jgi:hypothetical protein